MYIIHATIDMPTKTKTALGTLQELISIPKFFVNAKSRDDALVMAKVIVDPARMVDTRITAEEAPKEPYRQSLEEELSNAVRALNGDSNDAKHGALLGLAETVAGYLGRDWNKLFFLNGEDEGNE
jgi:hypothetical protein